MIIQKIIFSPKIQPDPKVGNTSEPSDVEGEEQQGDMDDGYHYPQGINLVGVVSKFNLKERKDILSF